MRYLILSILTIIISIFTSSITFAEELVRVKLVNHVNETSRLSIQLKGEYTTISPMIKMKEGVTYTLFIEKDSLILKGEGEQQKLHDSFILIPKKYDYNHVISINDRPYLGAMEFLIEGKKYIRPVNQLPLEDYLKGVVPFEVYPSWELETLKAQALAARTYAVSRIDEIIDDTIRFQVYGGYTWHDKTTRAVEETTGEVITYKNKLIQAFYSASNGGITESNKHVWGGKPLPYLPIQSDPYDPTHPWSYNLSKEQIDLAKIDWEDPNWWDSIQEKDIDITANMKAWLNKNGYPGDIKILSIPQFELSNKQLKSSRRVLGTIKVEFLQRLFDGTVLYRQYKSYEVNLNKIRPMIGGNYFKSYFIESLDEEEGTYTMNGRGNGHGVGMSQWGASVMGEQGKNYKQIINYYYPGTKIDQASNIKKRKEVK